MLDTPSIVPFSRTEREKIQLSFERDQSITRASSRLRPSTRDSVRSEHVSFRLLTNSKPARLDRFLFHIRIIAFSFLENGPRIHENTVIRSRERERESTLPLCCQGEISVEIWDSTFASIHVKFSWERKFTSRRFQIRLEGLRITWLREKVFSWPVDKLLDGRSRGRGSWQESGLKSYLTISSNAWIMEIESVGLYLQEGIIRRMLLGGENSRVSSTIPSVVERDLCSI